MTSKPRIQRAKNVVKGSRSDGAENTQTLNKKHVCLALLYDAMQFLKAVRMPHTTSYSTSVIYATGGCTVSQCKSHFLSVHLSKMPPCN